MKKKTEWYESEDKAQISEDLNAGKFKYPVQLNLSNLGKCPTCGYYGKVRNEESGMDICEKSHLYASATAIVS